MRRIIKRSENISGKKKLNQREKTIIFFPEVWESESRFEYEK